MANTARRADYVDRNGNMYIPMNVEGGQYRENFITTPKLLTMAAILLSLFLIISNCTSKEMGVGSWIIWLGMWFIASFYATRFIIFEEKFYYRMYKELSKNEVSTPALFWNIASIQDTDEGAIIRFSDARIAVMVRLERDTITGKSKDFKETHYDAISDFYKEVIVNKYSFVQLNIMEQAGKDPRLNELGKIVTKSDNPNIRKLMELQVGHIKNITRATLYESDYFLFYTDDPSKVDSIIPDISECIFKILDGAYISYQFLVSKDIVDLVKELYGVNYFNASEASLAMFQRTEEANISPFNVYGIVWNDGYEQKLKPDEIQRLRTLTTNVVNEKMKSSEIDLKKRIYKVDEMDRVGIDFDTLSDVQVKKPRQTAQTGQGQPQQSRRQPNKVTASLRKRPEASNNRKSQQPAQGNRQQVKVNIQKDDYQQAGNNQSYQGSNQNYQNNYQSNNNGNNYTDDSQDNEYIDF